MKNQSISQIGEMPNRWLQQDCRLFGRYSISEKKGGGGGGYLLSTDQWRIRDVFLLFLIWRGPLKGRGEP